MATRRLRSRAQINADQASHPTSASSRPRRAAAAPTSATIERTSPEESRQSIHLTVKAAPSKLREATSGNSSHPRRTAGVNSRDSFVGGEIVVGQRSSRNKKTIVEETSEEELDEDELGDDDVEEDDDEDEEMADDDDADADADEDVDMEDSLPAPPPPAVKAKGKQQQKPSIKVSQAEREVPSVEAKEMAMEDDQSEDEELSELESDEPEDEEGEEEDAEGEEDDLDDELDSDEETPLSGSRAGTPDLSKLTRRQRAAFETYEGELIALSNEAQKKKHLTAEEHAMRRAEMARRRKNLSEKRNEEEKMDTINRLLKKQAPKRRGKAQVDADGAGEDDIDYERASPLYIRYIQTAENSQIAVPHEWLESPLGELMAKSKPATVKTPFSGRMVQEVA
ncbi:PAPA-1-like conserved region-domain-containing protein [Macrophomina phaseolina]|uniref:PAPA-1-like conserved region-domain-containing protein n=1 Tax=Macrophomina phaseolina TaxID=35725 RepID=A0ABQ8GUD1_9PEZI|nr:PAPA-1-like conserved region-domain-containing protein [Macrophomina phaseolina]